MRKTYLCLQCFVAINWYVFGFNVTVIQRPYLLAILCKWEIFNQEWLLWLPVTVVTTHLIKHGELYLHLLLSPIIYSTGSVLCVSVFVCSGSECLCVCCVHMCFAVCLWSFMALTVPSSLRNELFRHTVAYYKVPLVRWRVSEVLKYQHQQRVLRK